MDVRKNLFRRGNLFEGRKLEVDGTGTKECAQNKNRTAKSVNILICFMLLKIILIVS